MNEINTDKALSKNDKLLGCILLIIGVIIGFLSLDDYITKSKSIAFRHTFGIVNEFRKTTTIRGRTQIAFKYEYHVDNKTYYNNIVGYGLGNVYDYESRFYDRTLIDVYYDKEDPSKSVLVRGVSFFYALGLIIGIFIILLGIVTTTSHRHPLIKKIYDGIWG